MAAPAGPAKRSPTRERLTPRRREQAPPRGRSAKPPWLKIRIRTGEGYKSVRRTMDTLALHTVCEEARCPNIFECWGERTATFMILGDVCTRRCGFCAVMTGRPLGVDPGEPARLAEAVARLELAHAVITSVDRDDLPDGGAAHFAAVIGAVRRRRPECAVEVLTPDFRGAPEALRTLLAASPDVFAHNVETVPRLYRSVRPGSDYRHSLALLSRAKESGAPVSKSGFMLGLGESRDEIRQLLADLREARVEVVTIGQYLRPTAGHLPVERYVPPSEFEEIRREALPLGFRHVEAGPLVRSSYHAARHLEKAGAGAAEGAP
ncbi:MAG TPA: lipoyl synthase [Candidatus Polarisedimenticolia bacterium]|jgi:lipoic acid synthetase|nr:lipoyl synthase [Candidatus Polarisedimenticolia bacterium]